MADKQLHYQNLTKLLAAGFFICAIIASQVIPHRPDGTNNHLDHQIDFLTPLIDLYPRDYPKQQNSLNQLFQASSASGNMVGLLLINTNGQQVAHAAPYREQVTGNNSQDQSWFSEVLVRGAHVSDPFSGYRKIPHFVVALTDPLKRDVLRTTIHSNIFNALLLGAQIGTNGDIFIVNKAGEIQPPRSQHITPLAGSIEAHSNEGEGTVFTVKDRSTRFKHDNR